MLANKEVVTAVPPPVKKMGRSVSAFAQNVKAMNFFSVFVDTKKPSLQGSQELAALANHNRDEKVEAPRPIARSSSNIDHKDDKTTRDTKCACGSSLTNEMIKELVLQSPLKDMVDHIHWKLFNDRSTVPNAGQGGAQFQQPFDPGSSKNAAYPLNQRTDVQVLNMILDQMLSGKFYYGSDKMYDRLAEKNLLQGTERFLQGADFKAMLMEQQEAVAKQARGELEVELFDENAEEGTEDFFNMRSLREKEKELESLLETGKLRKKVKVAEREDTATFLTQVFKDSDVKRNALERTFPDWERGQDIPT